MNTRIFKIVLVLIITLNVSCKKTEVKLAEYKYESLPETITCNSGYDNLLKEALYTFEEDIVNKYDSKNKNKLRAYRAYISNFISNRIALEETITPHSKAVYDVLKSKQDLWDNNQLNYNNTVVKCIIDNMKDKGLQQTLNALISTNSMNSQIFAAPLRSNTSYSRDTNLATIVALELYFSKFNSIDFTTLDLTVNQPKDQPVDFNKRPITAPAKSIKEVDHTGHDHD
ncbi:hypothetical protein [Olleya marilimosa]|uniref:hypothetical protein n=1 Tax=Olleya marilimosa TaxID=272164 RepID=UPI0030EC35BA|tara:strand:+ start:164351 stop:165034 length:684 start_codon:yes stop_codon:yes gene_type:complete